MGWNTRQVGDVAGVLAVVVAGKSLQGLVYRLFDIAVDGRGCVFHRARSVSALWNEGL